MGRHGYSRTRNKSRIYRAATFRFSFWSWARQVGWRLYLTWCACMASITLSFVFWERTAHWGTTSANRPKIENCQIQPQLRLAILHWHSLVVLFGFERQVLTAGCLTYSKVFGERQTVQTYAVEWSTSHDIWQIRPKFTYQITLQILISGSVA